MKLLPNDTHFVDYAELELQDATYRALYRFSAEELICRAHFRMEAGLESCDAQEQQARREGLRQVMQQNFGSQTAEPYTVSEQVLGMEHSISVLKRSRYFPSLEYRHENFEFFYVFSGECTHICKGEPYTLRPGDFCLLEYGVPHRLCIDSDDCILLELVVRRQLLDQICNALLQENTVLSRFFKSVLYGNSNYPMIVFHTGADRAVKNYVYAMYMEYHNGGSCQHILLEAFLNALFVILMRNFQPQQEQPHAMANTPIGAILEYLRSNEGEITLSTLAEAFGYSVPYMSKLIRSSTGHTFTELLRQIRMRRASWLLKNTTLSSTEIAAEVHCVDTSHFARTFRREFQMSPGEYRELFSAIARPDRG